MKSLEEKGSAFMRLVRILEVLRQKCPWDRKQTWESLRILTIEELYELVDAIDGCDVEGVKEEIGDLMMHMVFYARIAEERGWFDVADALHRVCDKLERRHPHIFGDLKVDSAEEVKQNWERIKLKEGKKSLLDGVPRALPALVKAYRLQEKTAQVGFEWENPQQVWDKVQEELRELQEAVQSGDQEAIHNEYGDVLFALVNYARFIGVDPEAALESVNRRFKERFEYIEQHAPKPLHEMSLDEMDQLWKEAKQHEK